MKKKFKKPTSIPSSVKACLWFANPKKIDWDSQKDVIITSILNRGTWEAVRWAHAFYGRSAFRKVVLKPQRGLWFAQALSFWLLFFKKELPKKNIQEALSSFQP